MRNLERATARPVVDPATEEVPSSIIDAENCFGQGDLKGAASHFLSAIKSHPKNARAWNGMGVCFHRLGELTGAITAFRKAIEYNPEDPASQGNLNQVLWGQGEHVEAITLARKLLKQFPDLDVLREQLWSAGVERSDRPEALLINAELNAEVTRALLQEHLSDHLIRPIQSELTRLLSPSADAADADVLREMIVSANPAVLALSAKLPGAQALIDCAQDNGAAVLLFDADVAQEAKPGVVAVNSAEPDAVAAACREVSKLPTSNGGASPRPPHISLIVQASNDQELLDHLDRVALQGLHPALIEVLVIADKRPQVERALKDVSLPFFHRIVSDYPEARRFATGRLIAPAPFVALEQPGVLLQLLSEAHAERPVRINGENCVPRTNARVCAVVKGQGNATYAETTLKALRTHQGPEDLRIIYVDDGSESTALDVLAEAFNDVEFVRVPAQRGTSRGLNTGLLLASIEPHEFILLLNGDAAPPVEDPGWLTRWIDTFKKSTVGMAGAVSEAVTGQQHIEHCPQTYMRSFTRNQGPGGQRGRPPIPYAVSFAALIRREALDAVGWLVDERLGSTNCEDADLSVRIREHGWEVVVAQSVWIHQQRPTGFSYQCSDGHLEANGEKLAEKYSAERLERLGIKVTS